MRKLLLLSVVLLCSLSTWAVQRSSDEALAIARSFFMQSSDATTRSAADVQLVAVSGDLLQSTTTRNITDAPTFYVFNNAQVAYVIVSGDDRMKPILGYSDSGAFITENLPQNLVSWLELYNASYAELLSSSATKKEPYMITRATFPESVTPMLGEINWNQDAPYNNACPLVQEQRSVTGCVATAMAMIMKYHEYPLKGKGTHSYTTSTGISASFNFGNTTFDWANMLPQYVAGKYTTAQADAVAQLMYACGVAINMEYSPSSSGAYSFAVAQALIDYFGYDENLGYVNRQHFTSTEWMDMLKTELSASRPVLYNGASKDVGHEFVFDGYDAQNMVHVNWGWGGINNGYFEVASLNPSSPGIGGGSNLGGGYIYQQGMILGFCPPVTTSAYMSHFSLEKLETSKSEVAKGEKFDVTITNVFNASTTFKSGHIALVAEKDGVRTTLWSQAIRDVKTNYGFKSLPISDVSIPKEFSNGIYALYIGTKEARETDWSRVRGAAGFETQMTLAVDSEKCTLTPFKGILNLDEDLSGSVESLHALYSGRKGDFRMLLSNKNSVADFYGLAGVAFLTKEENPKFVALVGYTQLELPPNELNRELIISGDLIANLTENASNIPAGEYYICPGLGWGEYVYSIGEELLSVTVNRSYGSPTLVVNNARLEKTQLEMGEKLRLLADLSLSGSGNVYDEKLMAAIFKVGEGATSNLHYAEVFIEKEKALDFKMEIDLAVGEGKYRINLYKPSLLGEYDSQNPLCALPFTVGPTTGIEDQTADEKILTIYQSASDEMLRVRSSKMIKSIYIYNLTGQLVMQKEVDSIVNKEYLLSVKGLLNGCYVVVIQSVDGNRYSDKFIK